MVPKKYSRKHGKGKGKGKGKHGKHISKKLKHSLKFGLGYEGQTSFPNAKAAPYFGYEEPFINASEWFYPVAENAYQSPEMLKNFSSFGRKSYLSKFNHHVKKLSGLKKKHSHKHILTDKDLETVYAHDVDPKTRQNNRIAKAKEDAIQFFRDNSDRITYRFGSTKKHRKPRRKSHKKSCGC